MGGPHWDELKQWDFCYPSMSRADAEALVSADDGVDFLVRHCSRVHCVAATSRAPDGAVLSAAWFMDPDTRQVCAGSFSHEGPPWFADPVDAMLAHAERCSSRFRQCLWASVRRRIAEVSVALQTLELPALLTLGIVDELVYGADRLPIHLRYKVICSVKHFESQ